MPNEFFEHCAAKGGMVSCAVQFRRKAVFSKSLDRQIVGGNRRACHSTSPRKAFGSPKEAEGKRKFPCLRPNSELRCASR